MPKIESKCYLTPKQVDNSIIIPDLNLENIADILTGILGKNYEIRNDFQLSTLDSDGQLKIINKFKFHTTKGSPSAPNPYPNKKGVLEALQKVANLLLGEELTLDRKKALAVSALDGLEMCTGGYHTQLNKLLVLQSMPQNIDELLFAVRVDIVERVYQNNVKLERTGYEVHLYNDLYTQAAKEYGVLAINPDDIYHSRSFTQEQIKEKLQKAFNTQYGFFEILNALKEKMKSALINVGYSGKKDAEDDYKSGQYEKFMEFFNLVFSPDVMERQDVLVLNGECQTLDINWHYIQRKLCEKLNDDGYVGFNNYDITLLNCLFTSDPPTLEAFKQCLGNENFVMYAVRDFPAAMPALLDAMKDFKPSDKAMLLKQVTSDGWNVVMLTARYSPAAMPALLDAMKDFGQSDKETLLKQVARDGRNAVMLTARYSPAAMPALLYVMKDFEPSDKATLLKQVASDGWNAVMLTAGYSPAAMPALLNVMKDFEPSDIIVITDNADYFKENFLFLEQIKFDTHLSGFQAKYEQMIIKAATNPKYTRAAKVAKTLISNLQQAKKDFILSKDKIDVRKAAFVKASLDALADARLVLNEHREWKPELAKFTLILLTLPLSIFIAAPLYCTGFFKTNTAKKVDALERDFGMVQKSRF